MLILHLLGTRSLFTPRESRTTFFLGTISINIVVDNKPILVWLDSSIHLHWLLERSSLAQRSRAQTPHLWTYRSVSHFLSLQSHFYLPRSIYASNQKPKPLMLFWFFFFRLCLFLGAVVASPTFSLPEYIGGTRNWYVYHAYLERFNHDG